MKNIAVVGAGIVGLAHAYAYAKRGYRVRVYERSPRAAGASIRNFGMLWPIGQPRGAMHEMALDSRRLWVEVLEAARIPFSAEGSLHATYHADEEAVAREFADNEPDRAEWLEPAAALSKSSALRSEGLRGALFSTSEVVVDPRIALWTIPEFLDERLGVQFSFSTAITEVRSLNADRVVICNGHDFETLYPEIFSASDLTRCKLQMLRTRPQPSGWRFGPALAGGLTLRFYPSFSRCSSLGALQQRVANEFGEYDRWGIHVMAAPAADNTVTLGDSHEYGLMVEAFNREEIDTLILKYLATFAQFPVTEVGQRWHGVYAKHPTRPYFVNEPESGVRVVSGLGGAGMTLSFGLAEHLVAADEKSQVSTFSSSKASDIS